VVRWMIRSTVLSWFVSQKLRGILAKVYCRKFRRTRQGGGRPTRFPKRSAIFETSQARGKGIIEI
jgi:hypothetical protein